MIIMLLAGSLLAGCGGQKSESKTKNNTEMTPITKEQYNSISKQIKTFDHNPTYQVRFNTAFCTYEIYINDMLVTFSFTTGNTAGEQSADIPQYILKSGKQHLKIRVYPRAIEAGKLETSLGAKAMLNARIVYGEYGKDQPDAFKEVLKLEMPAESANLPYYELNGIFEAEVPYSLNGWSGGVELSKEKKEDLQKEVVQVYERFRTAFENKDIATIASMIYSREQEVAQAFFFKSGEAGSYDQGWEKLQKEAGAIEKIGLTRQYSMRFFGDGKVVALLQDTGEDRDFPALEAETKEKFVFYALYLYRPRPGAALEVIR